MSRVFDALRQFDEDARKGKTKPDAPKDTPKDAASPAPQDVVVPELPPLPDLDFGPMEPATSSFLPPPVPLSSPAAHEQLPPEPPPPASPPVVRAATSPAPHVTSKPAAAPSPVYGSSHPGGFDLDQLISVNALPPDDGHLVSMTDEHGLGAEKFRVLATRLANIRRNTGLQVIQITSSIIGEGKTLVSTNLAATLARRSGQSVLLVEGDLRKPAVCPVLGLTSTNGIGEWWNQADASIIPFLRRINNTQLCLLPAGTTPHPVSVLQSGRMNDLMAQFRIWFDWVIVDTPPLLPMADSNLWARLVDGTLLVIREGVAPRRALQRAMESMDAPKLVGVVLNDADDFDRVDYYDQYYSTRPKEPPKEPAAKAKGPEKKPRKERK